MSNLTEEELNRLCWSLVHGAAQGMYSWLDMHATPEEEQEEWMNEEEEYRMLGRGTSALDTADILHTLDVDVGFRALTYAEEEDRNLYPTWITDEGYEPHFRLSETDTYRVISEKDDEKYYRD